ncbi:hypothetical protein [Amycolatopsis sp. NPDC049868]|uniref:WXG100-like domain-containing protein n=1 Tax=Amycolatopsis sp. NPDC049868 TaxID=3363934 RepID=UPI00378E8260
MPIKVDRGDFGDVPEWARTLLEVLGVSWPAANQHKFRRAAQEYDTVTELLNELPDDIARVKRAIDEKLSMPEAGEAFDKSMKPLTGGSPNLLGELAEGTKGIADGCRKIALDVEYTKFSAIGQLFLLAYEIAMEYALAVVTGGASLANLTWHYALTRGYLLVLFKMLVRAIVFEMFIGITGGLIIDAAVQRLQRERTEWDDETTKQTAISGAIGGLLGGAVGELGEKLGRKIGGLLGKDFGKVATDDLLKLVKDLKLPGGDALADDWVRDIGRTLTDRAGKQFTDPATAFTKRAIEGFSDEVADRFVTAFGKTLGDDAARQLGRDYARAFVDNWTRHGLDGSKAFNDSLGKVLAPYDGKLGKDAVGLLTDHVPDVLSRNATERLGGNLAARAVEFSTVFLFEGVSGVMSQAVMAALNGESVSAAEYGMGFAGGVVGGAVSHKLEGIGERALDSAVTSMKEKFGDAPASPVPVPPPSATNTPSTTSAGASAPAASTSPNPASTSDVKSTSDTKAASETKTQSTTKSTSDTKTVSDGKPVSKSTSDSKPAEVKTTSSGKTESAPAPVRTSSEAGTVEEAPPVSEERHEDEERPHTRPAPLRTSSEDQDLGSASVAVSEQAPTIELDLGKPFAEDLGDLAGHHQEDTEPLPEDVPATTEAPETKSDSDTDAQDLTVADLPPFLATGQALGSAPVLAVEGTAGLRDELARLLPGIEADDLRAIENAVHDDFESVLSGLHFPLRTGKGRREVRIRATVGGEVVSEPKEKTKADLTVQGGTSNSENLTVFDAGDLGTAATVQMPMGPYLTVGGKVALAAPGATQAVTVSTSDQRAIRSGEGSRRVRLNVEFTVSVHDESGAEVGQARARPIPGHVTVRLPDDLVGLTPQTGLAAKDLDADVGRKLQNPVPEAVTDLGDVFTGTAGLLPRSVTALGSPGRDTLRAFLGTAGIRENFGPMLAGWVSSPALLSADGGKVAAVRMKAVLTKAEFVGPTSGTQLRLHDSTTTGSTTSAFTKRGFDAAVSFGGGGGVNAAKIAAGIGAGYSARTVDTVVSGRTTTTKSGVQLKGDVGLYRFETTIVVQALDGGETTTTATVYARLGMAEAAAQRLPVPEGTGDGITPPSTEKFPPAHLAAGLAAGNVRVGEFTGAEAVLTEIRDKLRETGRYKDLLPGWNDEQESAGASRTLEMLANERLLDTALSPSALRGRMDALLGAGVSVTLKRRGVLRQDNVTITVRLETTRSEHIGSATGRVTRNATTTGPALGSSATTSKGWTAGPEGKVALGVTATAAVKYGVSGGVRTGAGPVTDSTDLTIGGADSEGFRHEGRFVVSITGFSRVNATVRQLLPGLPGIQVPDVRRIWTTPEEREDGSVPLPAGFTVWMSDSLTLPAEAEQVAPGEPKVSDLDPPRSITGHFAELDPPVVGDWIGVESIAHTGHVGTAALEALVEASDEDRALALPGSDAWTVVQTMLSTDNLKAALRSFTRGVLSTDLVHSRRLADRVGRIGVQAKLSKPTLVRVADDVASERSATGGFRFDGGTSKSTGPVITAGLTGTGSVNDDPTGSATGGLSGKPWAKTTTTADGLDISAVVDRNVTTAAGTPRVLARFDLDFTVLAEARQQTALIRPDARVAARSVHLPGAALVWLTEDQAREHGLLPAKPAGPRERIERLAAPSTLPEGKPGALGLGAVERMPDLSDLVPKLSEELIKAKIPLLPGVSLNDVMHTWARLTDLVSPDGVRGLVDSALDGGIPLHAHLPKLFTDSGYQILLTAKTLRNPVFREVVNDGRTVEHSTVRAVRTSRTGGTAEAWSVAVRAGGQEKFQNTDGGATTSAGGAVTKGIGVTKAVGVTEVRTEQETRLRTGTGPAALFDVPIEFTLDVRRNGVSVASANTGERLLGVRLLADNLSIGGETDTGGDSGSNPLSAADATPAALAEWRQGSVAELPEMASVESVRAAAELRDAVRDTLTKAGADSGITGYGTGPVNALWSSLSPQVLQAFLPGMTTKSLPIPVLRDGAVLRGKRADVEVHARLGKPRTIALSDGVNLEKPKTSATAARSAERKVAEATEMGVTGPTVTPVDDKGGIGGLLTGADARWTGEPTGATADGTTVSAVANLKPAGRTALVRFDVDYRIVVKVGGRTEVVDVSLPASADVRMPIEGLPDVTGQKTPRVLKARQGRVARTAKAWRDAEVGAEGQRRRAEQLVEKLGADVDWNATVDAARVRRPGTLAERHHEYARETEKALREAENVAEAALLHHERVSAEADAVTAALKARTVDLDDLTQGTADADRAFRVLSSELAAARAKGDLAEALGDVRRLTRERADAKQRRDLFREVLAEQRESLALAEAAAVETREQRVAAAEQMIRTQAALQAAWLDFVDTKQDAWWLAKDALDAEFARLAAPPGSPEDEKWRHSRATDAPWFSVAEPLDPADWEPLRATTPRRSVATETADVLTTLLSGKDKRYDGVIRYGVSRFKVGERSVTEFTVPINLVPGRGVTEEQLARLRERATAGVEKLINKRHGLPNGDQLHVRIEFTGDRLTDRDGNPRYRPYDVVAGDGERTTQTNWRSDATPEELAHEVLHYLGAADEEHDKARVFLSREDDGTTGVVTGDESIMGKGVVTPGVTPKLMPRHTWMIQHVLHAQLGPGHRLTDPGQDALPGVLPSSTEPAPAHSGLTATQRDTLDRLGKTAVPAGGEPVTGNLIAAIAASVAPESPARQAELRKLGAGLRNTTAAKIAEAFGVRLHVVTENGEDLGYGPAGPPPVRIVRTADGDYLATRDLDTRIASRPVPNRPETDAELFGRLGDSRFDPAEPGALTQLAMEIGVEPDFAVMEDDFEGALAREVRNLARLLDASGGAFSLPRLKAMRVVAQAARTELGLDAGAEVTLAHLDLAADLLDWTGGHADLLDHVVAGNRSPARDGLRNPAASTTVAAPGEPVTTVAGRPDASYPAASDFVRFAERSHELDEAGRETVREFTRWAWEQARRSQAETGATPRIEIRGFGNSAVTGRAAQRARTVAGAVRDQLRNLSAKTGDGATPRVVIEAGLPDFAPIDGPDPAKWLRTATLRLTTGENLAGPLGCVPLRPGESVTDWVARTVAELPSAPAHLATGPLTGYLDKARAAGRGQKAEISMRLNVARDRRPGTWTDFTLPDGTTVSLTYDPASGEARFGTGSSRPDATYEVKISPDQAIGVLDFAMRSAVTRPGGIKNTEARFNRGLFHRTLGTSLPGKEALFDDLGGMHRGMLRRPGGVLTADGRTAPVITESTPLPARPLRYAGADPVKSVAVAEFHSREERDGRLREFAEKVFAETADHLLAGHGLPVIRVEAGKSTAFTGEVVGELSRQLGEAARRAEKTGDFPGVAIDFDKVTKDIVGSDGIGDAVTFRVVRPRPPAALETEPSGGTSIRPGEPVKAWVERRAADRGLDPAVVSGFVGELIDRVQYLRDHARDGLPSLRFRLHVNVGSDKAGLAVDGLRGRERRTGHAYVSFSDKSGFFAGLGFGPVQPGMREQGEVWREDDSSTFAVEYQVSANDVLRGIDHMIDSWDHDYELLGHNCVTFARDMHTKVTGLPAPSGGLLFQNPYDMAENLRKTPGRFAVTAAASADREQVEERVKTYSEAMATSPLADPADTHVRTVIRELVTLPGVKRVEDFSGASVHSMAIRDRLEAIRTGLANLGDDATRAKVRRAVTDALIATGFVPVREGTAGRSRERQVLRPISPGLLGEVLDGVAATLAAGKDPFTEPGSPLRGYRADVGLPARWATLATLNLTESARTGLRNDPLFQALQGNPDALIEALFAGTGHERLAFAGRGAEAIVNAGLRRTVPTIAGLLHVGRAATAHAERIAPERRQRIAVIDREFDAIRDRAFTLAAEVPTAATRREWAALTTRWSRAMQKLGAVLRPGGPHTALPVFAGRMLPGAWSPVSSASIAPVAAATDDCLVSPSIPGQGTTPVPDGDLAQFRRDVVRRGGILMTSSTGPLRLDVTTLDDEPVYLLDDPLRPGVEYLSESSFLDAVRDRRLEEAELLPKRAPVTESPVVVANDVETIPLGGNSGIRLTDARLDGLADRLPADDRFFTFLAHGGPNGAPVRIASGAGSTPLTPFEVATMLVHARDEGWWDGVKPLMFASCGAGVGGRESFAAQVLSELRERGIDVEAVAPDGPVYLVPGEEGRTGHLVVTGKVGFDVFGRPVVEPNGNWVRLGGSTAEAEPIGAHIVVEENENPRTGPVPGYGTGKPVIESKDAVRLADEDEADSPPPRPSPPSRTPSESSQSSIEVNTIEISFPYPGRILGRDVLYSGQREVLAVHGMEPVLVEGDTRHDSFREALVASLPDDIPRERARIMAGLDEFTAAHPDNTDLGAIAEAAGVRVHVLERDGTWTSHGHPTARPVHILRADVDGEERYLGTTENVHIGRPNVRYPGSTVLLTGHGRKVLHRGEFEIETIKGKHYVRLYTAILTPAARESAFKDVHQDEDGKVDPFSGEGSTGAKIFWVGGGRPLRAVQWTAKYENDPERKDFMQPMLRSFLVPLDVFLDVTEQSVVEAVSSDSELSMNVDQNGDTNQFGLRGQQYEQLRKKVLPGSLVTYTVGGRVTVMPEFAGRQEDLADLYVRLGLRPDFESDALGKEHDPWFTWNTKGQTYFRNDPKALRSLARTLSDHYHTWHKSPEAFFSPPADVIPEFPRPATRVVLDDKTRREGEMNAFLNTHGPGKELVEKFTDRLWAAMEEKVRKHAGKGVEVTEGDLRATVSGQLNKSLNNPHLVLVEATKMLIGQREGLPKVSTLKEIEEAMQADRLISIRAGIAVADAVLDSLRAGFGKEVEDGKFGQGLGDLVLEIVQNRFEALETRWVEELEEKTAVKEEEKKAKEEERRKKAEEKGGAKKEPRKAEDQGEPKKKREKPFLGGTRGEVFTQTITDELLKGEKFKKLLSTKVKIGPDSFAAQFKSRILAKALDSITRSELVGVGETEVRERFRDWVKNSAGALSTELTHKNAARFGALADRKKLAELASAAVQDPVLVNDMPIAPVPRAAGDEFMDLVPQFATQAEIGSVIATDERRIKNDFDTRAGELEQGMVPFSPYANEYASWRDKYVLGYTQKQDPSVFRRHRRIGEELARTIQGQLDQPDVRSGRVILDQLLSELDEGLTDDFDKLKRKFDETVKIQPVRPDKNEQVGPPDRAEGQVAPNTFGEHAQMVLNRYLALTSRQGDAGRFVRREAVVKAILFHDMDKVNSKHQYGDAQVSHDLEPEHRGAVQYMNRHEGLWASRRDFELVRAFVDSDPFGYYFRGMGGMTAEDVYNFVRSLAVRVGRPGGGTPTAADVRNLFREFHQYYQADFSSYSEQAKFVNDTTHKVQAGYDKLTGVLVVNGEHVPVDGEHRFAYTSAYEKKFEELAAVFDRAVALEPHRAAKAPVRSTPVVEDVASDIFAALVPETSRADRLEEFLDRLVDPGVVGLDEVAELLGMLDAEAAVIPGASRPVAQTRREAVANLLWARDAANRASAERRRLAPRVAGGAGTSRDGGDLGAAEAAVDAALIAESQAEADLLAWGLEPGQLEETITRWLSGR